MTDEQILKILNYEIAECTFAIDEQKGLHIIEELSSKEQEVIISKLSTIMLKLGYEFNSFDLKLENDEGEVELFDSFVMDKNWFKMPPKKINIYK